MIQHRQMGHAEEQLVTGFAKVSKFKSYNRFQYSYKFSLRSLGFTIWELFVLCCLCIVSWLNLTAERWFIIVISDQSSSNSGRLCTLSYMTIPLSLVSSIWSEFTFFESKTLTNWVGRRLLMSCYLNFMLLLIFYLSCYTWFGFDCTLKNSKVQNIRLYVKFECIIKFKSTRVHPYSFIIAVWVHVQVPQLY